MQKDRLLGQLSTHRYRKISVSVLAALLFVVGILYMSLPSNRPHKPASFVTRISAEIPGIQDLPPFVQLEAVRNWVFENTNVPAHEAFFLVYDKYPLHTLTVEDMLQLHHEHTGGHYCAGVNYILKRVYEELGYRSWMYSYGDQNSVTHAVALVEVQGELYLQDAYFNLTYVDRQDRPVPFYAILENLADRTEPTLRVGPSLWRNIHVKDKTEAAGAGLWAMTGIDQHTCRALKEHHFVCKSQTSLDNFIRGFPPQLLDKSYAFLNNSGLPESLHYLLLFPLGITSEEWIDDPAKSEILRRIIAIRDKAYRVSTNTR